jgi:pimeloyl-[acyl-carrier protein] synthase
VASTEMLFNPFLPEFQADPYPFYHRLRTQDPVHRHPMGFWVLTRYEDVLTALRDPRFGRRGLDEILIDVYGDDSEPGGLPRSLLFQDPPDHTRLRSLVARPFTAPAVEAMRPSIQSLVDELLDRAEERNAIDLIADVAYPLPFLVICQMLGVPGDDRTEIRHWSADLARSVDALGPLGDSRLRERGRRARRALGDYFRGLVAERRRRPQGDLLSALIAAEEQGNRLTEGDVLAMCVLLFVAGHVTSANLIGNGVLALLQHPDQLQRLREEPALIANAVEELLRYESPVQRFGRVPLADVEIEGRTIPAGAIVVGAIGAANRDPAHFHDPDRLDLGRRDNHHLAFGSGIHVCLGAPLARAEAQIAVASLFRRAPGLSLQATAPEWRHSSTLRGLKALPVTLAS